MDETQGGIEGGRGATDETQWGNEGEPTDETQREYEGGSRGQWMNTRGE